MTSAVVYLAVGFFASAPIVALAVGAVASAVAGVLRKSVLR